MANFPFPGYVLKIPNPALVPGLSVIWGQCCLRVAARPCLSNCQIIQLSPYLTRNPCSFECHFNWTWHSLYCILDSASDQIKRGAISRPSVGADKTNGRKIRYKTCAFLSLFSLHRLGNALARSLRRMRKSRVPPIRIRQQPFAFDLYAMPLPSKVGWAHLNNWR